MIIVDTSLPEGRTLNNLSPFNDLLPKKKTERLTGKDRNFTVAKAGKPYLDQVIKVNIINHKS